MEFIVINEFSTGNGTTSTFAIRMSDMSHSSSHNPSRISLDFRMLVRGQDGEPVGEEDIHCVGFFDHWMKKSSENKRKGKLNFISGILGNLECLRATQSAPELKYFSSTVSLRSS